MVKTILITGATDGTGKSLEIKAFFAFSKYLGAIPKDRCSMFYFFFKSYFPLAI